MSRGNLLMLGIPGAELDAPVASVLQRAQPAGVILFRRNIVSPIQLRRLTDQLRDLLGEDLIIGIDQEGGRVTRTQDIAPVLPDAAILATQANPQQLAQAGALTADLLMLLGCNLNFAPVLDIDHHPDAHNALRGRCWGADSQAVINRAGVWNRWQKRRGMRTCGKHFPAGGRAMADPHHDLPIAEVDLSTLLREDILPYTALMPELDAVMIAHVRYPMLDPQWPASLSRRIVTDFLRHQLGFDRHLVITDDLDMGAIRQHYSHGEDVKLAIRAGNDLAMICHQLDRVALAQQALEELSNAEVDDSLQRVARFRKRLSLPLPWSEQRWHQTCEEISALCQKFAPPAAAGETVISPVTQY